jgi:hypothetical protein
MGNMIAPAIKNPQDAVWMHTTMCVIQDAKTHKTNPIAKPFIFISSWLPVAVLKRLHGLALFLRCQIRLVLVAELAD